MATTVSVQVAGEKWKSFALSRLEYFTPTGIFIDGLTSVKTGLSGMRFFFGTANRKKSIKYGLVVFIKPEDHNMSEYGVHNRKGHEFDEHLKKLGQKTAMQYYGWGVDTFRKKFGKNYL